MVLDRLVFIQTREEGGKKTYEVIDRRPTTPKSRRIAGSYKTEASAQKLLEKLER